MQRRSILTLLASVAASGIGRTSAASALNPEDCASAHLAWVEAALKQMLTIKPGMTRETLLTVFATEGGLSTPLQRTFVSQHCPFFKVDVEFQPVNRPDRDKDERAYMAEGSDDRIVKISQPYLQFSIMD
jgi:hypothetical protein